jgi:hypothetical protein
MVDDNGKEIENTLEQRIKMCQRNNSLLSFIIEFAHDESNYMVEQKKKEEKDFLQSSKSSPKSTSTPSVSP